jgi:hypothetical protein
VVHDETGGGGDGSKAAHAKLGTAYLPTCTAELQIKFSSGDSPDASEQSSMCQKRRHLGIFLAAALAFCPWNVFAENTGPTRERTDASAERREEPIRIQVNVNLFFAGPAGESEEAVKLRERARRSLYEMAAGECVLVEQVLAKTCRLESVGVSINRQSGGQEGYMAGGNFVLRATLK